MDLTLDRTISFNGDCYRIIEVLGSNHLLVVKEVDYKKKDYPMLTHIIPGA